MSLEKDVKNLNWFDFLKKLKNILLELLGQISSVGGLQSISGDFVDNTDPENPVLNRGYKVYTALLSQAGTSDPTVTVLENTLGTVNISRYTTGITELNSSALFTVDKTFILFQAPKSVDGANGSYIIYDDEGLDSSIIRFQSNNPTFNATDGYNVIIEIRVYN